MPKGFALPVLICTTSLAACAVAGAQPSICTTSEAVVPLPGLPEASGVAMGRGQSRLWLHNDSGEAALIAVDAAGRQVGRVTVAGARVDDWEALAAGPCGKSWCLYVGDIGDNNATRKQITIYRLAEPASPTGEVTAEAFHAVYPDGAHDAEALFIAPDGTMFIVTKGDTGPVNVYRFPPDLRAGTTVRLERIGTLSAKPRAADRITDGAFASNGRWVVLRTGGALSFYRADEFVLGHFREMHRVDIGGLNEPQGEGVTFGPRNVVYVAGEGGGKKQPGTLAALECQP